MSETFTIISERVDDIPLLLAQSDTPGKAGGLMSRAASKAVDLTICVVD
jgi:hypothetical protein